MKDFADMVPLIMAYFLMFNTDYPQYRFPGKPMADPESAHLTFFNNGAALEFSFPIMGK